MSISDLKREIAAGWERTPAAELSYQIIDFMAPLDEQQLRMLTIPVLLDVLEKRQIDADFMAALAILANSSVQILDSKAIFADDDGDEYHLETEEFEEVRRANAFAHPESGELVPNYEAKLIPYFGPSERFLKARSDG